MTRIINGIVVEDGKKGTRVINVKNHFKNIDGNFVDGELISSSPGNDESVGQPRDLSKDGEAAIDVDAVEG
jgi:hypothetical protein